MDQEKKGKYFMPDYVRKIFVTVDLVIFTIRDSDLKVLLIKRDTPPFKDVWALPGGFFRIDRSLEEAAKQKLFDETGVKNVYLEQLYTFGNPKRDPRGRIITVSYFALTNSDNIRLDAHAPGVKDVKWFSIKAVPDLAFDHKNIISYALKRLRWKLEYTTVAYSLLPEKFTLTELQNSYEIIFGRKFDKRNFRKKILSLNILADTRNIKKESSHRPAKLYSFKKRSPEIIEIL